MLIIYIISHTFDYFELNVGEVAAVLLYFRLVMNNIGAFRTRAENFKKSTKAGDQDEPRGLGVREVRRS